MFPLKAAHGRLMLKTPAEAAWPPGYCFAMLPTQRVPNCHFRLKRCLLLNQRVLFVAPTLAFVEVIRWRCVHFAQAIAQIRETLSKSRRSVSKMNKLVLVNLAGQNALSTFLTKLL